MRRPNSTPAPGEAIPLEYLPADLAPIPYGADIEDEEAIRTALWILTSGTLAWLRALLAVYSWCSGPRRRAIERSQELIVTLPAV